MINRTTSLIHGNSSKINFANSPADKAWYISSGWLKIYIKNGDCSKSKKLYSPIDSNERSEYHKSEINIEHSETTKDLKAYHMLADILKNIDNILNSLAIKGAYQKNKIKFNVNLYPEYTSDFKDSLLAVFFKMLSVIWPLLTIILFIITRWNEWWVSEHRKNI